MDTDNRLVKACDEGQGQGGRGQLEEGGDIYNIFNNKDKKPNSMKTTWILATLIYWED